MMYFHHILYELLTLSGGRLCNPSDFHNFIHKHDGLAVVIRLSSSENTLTVKSEKRQHLQIILSLMIVLTLINYIIQKIDLESDV